MIVGGSIAALITPRTRGGELDGRSLHRLAESALAAGCSGICVNGATGEYTGSTLQEMRSIVELARSITPKDRLVIAGCGPLSIRIDAANDPAIGVQAARRS
jgi:4-hydroxy-tetrahydrodipicolinate synthase